jgi:hypothetical protein
MEGNNDFDSMAEGMDEVMRALAGGSYENVDEGSVEVNKDDWIKAIIRLQRLRNWCAGHAQARRDIEAAQ